MLGNQDYENVAYLRH